ncbi:DUF952 domain-containing protein [Sphingomonas solaris]|uniref:DUF952 domain-containing protein n=1 Tax=Alterirhizorhabdus solaris TaxID=2529389 RepID=A0A558QZS9_9SPHN|nr:DUF952 domain-containing protein [Sphingomonas solaris]TVV72598.1 DUF952 domain-containing protein [Sphingomonas solaris]
MTAAIAYKILTADQWAAFTAAGTFAGAPVDLADGYIHLSAEDQVAGTLAKHFAGQAGLVLATINLAMLGDAVRWEVSRGGALFPHVYAPLPLAAVTETRSLD